MSHHYAYIEETSKQFSKALDLKDDIGTMVPCHGDKIRQYEDAFNGAGIPYGKAALVYLLSYEYHYSTTVRDTDEGFVEPVKWVIQHCTQPGPIKDALDSLPKIIKCKEISVIEFHVYIDGTFQYRVERDLIAIPRGPGKPDFLRGHWILKKISYEEDGVAREENVYKDQYNSDLMERILHARYDPK